MMSLRSGIDMHLRFGALFAMLFGGLLAGAGDNAFSQDTDRLRKSVVNINCNIQPRDATRPWTRQPGFGAGGSGVVIAPGRVLTNAHVVHEATEVLLETDQTNLPVSGKVIAIDLGRDLALVEVDDQAFIEAHPPVELFEGLPADGSEVIVMGYPMGGESLSTTSGVISRCEWAGIGMMEEEGMRVQVDAAVNSGNSGGPGFVDDKIAGLAFSGLDNAYADNISYLIATEEIERFLREFQADSIDGNSIMNLYTQPLENPALRKKLGVKDSMSGIVIVEDELGRLKAWDVITKVNGSAVGNDGQITLQDGRKVSVGAAAGRFDPLVDGDMMEIELLRDGKPMTVQMAPVTARDGVIRSRPNGDYPYVVVGPLVFGPLHSALFDAHYEMGWEGIYFFGGGPALKHLYDVNPAEGKELVGLVCPMFPHPVGRGFDAYPGQTVASVNGQTFEDFAEFVEIIAGLDGTWVIFEFNEMGAPRLVFDREELFDATDDVMESNGIRRAASKGFRDIWAIED